MIIEKIKALVLALNIMLITSFATAQPQQTIPCQPLYKLETADIGGLMCTIASGYVKPSYDAETETYYCPEGSETGTIEDMGRACSVAEAIVEPTDCPTENTNCEEDTEECKNLGKDIVQLQLNDQGCSVGKINNCKCCCLNEDPPPPN